MNTYRQNEQTCVLLCGIYLSLIVHLFSYFANRKNIDQVLDQVLFVFACLFPQIGSEQICYVFLRDGNKR